MRRRRQPWRFDTGVDALLGFLGASLDELVAVVDAVLQAVRQESRTGHLPQCQSATAAVAACGGCVVVIVVVAAAQQIKVKSETIAAADCVTVAAIANQRHSGGGRPVEIKDGTEQSC